MSRRMLKFMGTMWLAGLHSLACGADRFLVTERDTSGFVINEHSHGTAFVVTDRELPGTPPAATRRPIVLLYSARWCAPCRAARQELERSRLPFEVRVVDVTVGGQPGYVDSLPYFEWDSPRGRWFAKWTSAADLVKRWELTH
jgi:hypothetical protein